MGDHGKEVRTNRRKGDLRKGAAQQKKSLKGEKKNGLKK